MHSFYFIKLIFTLCSPNQFSYNTFKPFMMIVMTHPSLDNNRRWLDDRLFSTGISIRTTSIIVCNPLMLFYYTNSHFMGKHHKTLDDVILYSQKKNTKTKHSLVFAISHHNRQTSGGVTIYNMRH